MKGKEDSVLSVQRLVMMKAVKVMKAEAGVKVVESKSTVEVMEVIASIATVVRIAIITAIIAAGVLGYPTTGAGRTQTASAEVCCKCFLISNYWRCGKKMPTVVATIVVGNPVIISNKPSGSADLAHLVSEAFRHGGEDLRAVIIKNHGVVAVGSNIDQARAVVEALEEWAKILRVSKIFGGPKYVLDNST